MTLDQIATDDVDMDQHLQIDLYDLFTDSGAISIYHDCHVNKYDNLTDRVTLFRLFRAAYTEWIRKITITVPQSVRNWRTLHLLNSLGKSMRRSP